MRQADRAAHVLALRELDHADRAAAAARCPRMPVCVMSRDCGSPNCTSERLDPMEPLAAIEVLASRARGCARRSSAPRTGTAGSRSVPLAVSITTIGTDGWAAAAGLAAAGLAVPAAWAPRQVAAPESARDGYSQTHGHLPDAWSHLRNLGDADSRTERAHHTGPAPRIDGPADVLPPGHQIQVDLRPERRGTTR